MVVVVVAVGAAGWGDVEVGAAVAAVYLRPLPLLLLLHDAVGRCERVQSVPAETEWSYRDLQRVRECDWGAGEKKGRVRGVASESVFTCSVLGIYLFIYLFLGGR